jgi:hypothetical protein
MWKWVQIDKEAERWSHETYDKNYGGRDKEEGDPVNLKTLKKLTGFKDRYTDTDG